MSVAPLSTIPRQLDYAQPPAWFQHPGLRRWTLRLLILGSIACVGSYSYGLLRQIRYLQLQAQCLGDIERADELAIRARQGVLGDVPGHFTVGGVELVSARGRRMVCIAFSSDVRLDSTGLITVSTRKPATMRVGSRNMWLNSTWLKTPVHLKHISSKVDPADPTHVQIDYECDGQRGVIDGWLMDDDSMKLEVRDGPLKDE